jgi:FtsP/CotA-like multicopper oxidase with cupredoxin domain
MLKLGLLTGGAAFFGRRLGSSDGGGGTTSFDFWDNPQSPQTTPFMDELQIPERAVAAEVRSGLVIPQWPPAFSKNRQFPGSIPPDPKCLAGKFQERREQLPPAAASSQTKTTAIYDIVEEEAMVKVHKQLDPTRLWRYRDLHATQPSGMAGPTLTAHLDQREALLVRFQNKLPAQRRPFGVPRTSIHYHGGHTEFCWDGFPTFDFFPGETYEYLYPMLDPGFAKGEPDDTERGATMWYHDHMFDFTAENVYSGLAGFFLAFDEKDADDETKGLQLPSGKHDLPLVIQDRLFAPDGSLIYNPFSHDGFLGDKFLVNGIIQPYHHVERRKYRLRLLDGSNARFYQIFLTKASGQTMTFDQIATEAGLMSAPIRNLQSVLLSPALRVDIVVDFTDCEPGTEVFLENRLIQTSGRGPDGVGSSGTPLLKFIVDGPKLGDGYKVPDVLRKFSPIKDADIRRAPIRSITLERTHGAWAINGQLVNLCNPMATVKRETPEIWRVVNKSGGWWHPLHIHHDFFRVLRRNGKTPPMNELDGMAKRETFILGPNAELDIYIKCQDFPGPIVFHCHNLEHEDMAMMGRFDVQ